jgi:uncharacterized protein (DUF1778 family)
MGTLTERLEIRLPPDKLRMLRQEAHKRGVSVAQLVRNAIDLLLEKDVQTRLQAAESLFKLEAPVAEWEVMKKEIEEAHLEVKK